MNSRYIAYFPLLVNTTVIGPLGKKNNSQINNNFVSCYISNECTY